MIVSPGALRALVLSGLFFAAGCTEGTSADEAAARGETLAEEKGCVGCHSTDGSRSVGPTWKGLAGSRVRLSDGTTVVADEAYLQESIRRPSAKTVDGFPQGLMESVIKPDSITQREAEDLIAYIETLD